MCQTKIKIILVNVSARLDIKCIILLDVEMEAMPSFKQDEGLYLVSHPYSKINELLLNTDLKSTLLLQLGPNS